MFLVSVLRIFKIAMGASCGETTSKVASSNVCIRQLCKKLCQSIIGMLQKVVLLEILKNPLLTRVADCTGMQALA